MLFIDDVNLCCGEDDEHKGPKSITLGGSCDHQHNDLVEDRPEEFIRGILYGTKPFDLGLADSTDTNSVEYKEVVGFSMALGPETIIHKGLMTDPKELFYYPENFLLRRQFGLILRSSRSAKFSLFRSNRFHRAVQHTSLVDVPSPPLYTLHTAMLAGLQRCLHHSNLSLSPDNMIVALKEIAHLTMQLFKEVESVVSQWPQVNSERTKWPSTNINLESIGKFCIPFYLARAHVSSLSSLLQLCSHEWRRTFDDPFPQSSHKYLILKMMNDHLEGIDIGRWGVTEEWRRNLIREVGDARGPIWLNPRLLHFRGVEKANSSDVEDDDEDEDVFMGEEDSDDGTESHLKASNYLPFDCNPIRACPSHHENGDSLKISQTTAPIEGSTQRIPSTTTPEESNHHQKHSKIYNFELDLRSGWNLEGVVHTQGIHMILRLVRFLSVRDKESHLLFNGYVGAPLQMALALAARICDRKCAIFNCLDSEAVPEGEKRSAQSSLVFDFHRFLKSCILRASGFTQTAVGENAPNTEHAFRKKNNPGEKHLFLSFHGSPVSYRRSHPEELVMVIGNFSHLPVSCKRTIISLLDFDGLLSLFEEEEISGMR